MVQVKETIILRLVLMTSLVQLVVYSVIGV